MISEAGGYGRLLSRIKAQYEQVISVLERGHEEEIYLSGKMMEIINTPATLNNYQYRTRDLLTKYLL